MAKTKFKLGTLVKPNKKAPKFAQKRFENRYSFKITEMLGNGYYTVDSYAKVGTVDKFKVQGSHYDTLEESVPTKTKTRVEVPKPSQSVKDFVESKYGTPKEEVPKLNGSLLAEDYTPNVKEEKSTLDKVVKLFIDEQQNAVDLIQKTIEPQLAEMTDRAVVMVIAEKLNKVPSPQVYKLMNYLTEMNPELKNEDLIDLYKKSEDVLENTLSQS